MSESTPGGDDRGPGAEPGDSNDTRGGAVGYAGNWGALAGQTFGVARCGLRDAGIAAKERDATCQTCLRSFYGADWLAEYGHRIPGYRTDLLE